MAKVPTPASIKHTPEQMQLAITKLQRRIAELEKFDINTVMQQYEPSLSVLAEKVNQTLEDILGQGTSEFHRFAVGSFEDLPLYIGGGEYPLERVRENVAQNIHETFLKLKSLVEIFEERIADSPTSQSNIASRPAAKGTPDTRRVFIVHGHNNGAKETVARYLENLDLSPVILHEQPNAGKTVIEKFESHSAVDFAVILFTPDDVGYPANDPQAAKSRARQNVVLELGFFMAALGRNRVCVLKVGDIEIPSDYAGVLYLPMDDAGSWRILLAKEMKATGMSVDLNKAL